MTLAHKRLQDDVLQLPQYTYRHRIFGTDLTLIGVMHIAPKAFYDSVQEEIDRLTDNPEVVFLLEGVLPKTPGKTTRKERALSKVLLGIAGIFSDLHKGHLVHQKKSLTYPEHRAVHGDVSSDDILPHMKIWRLRLVLGLLKFLVKRGLIDLSDTPKGRENARKFLLDSGDEEKTPEEIEAAEMLPVILGMPGDDIILEMRNNYVMSLVDESDPMEHPVLVWGAGHIPGLAEILEERGYEQVGEPIWRSVMGVEDLVDTEGEVR